MSQLINHSRGRIAPKQIKLIKMAQKDLKLDDNVYRTLLRDRFKAKSCTDLTYSQAAELIDQFIQWGFVIIGKKGKPAASAKDASRKRQIDKIGALLTVGKRPWSYADALAKRICRNEDGQPIERLKFVPTAQLFKIIAALSKQAKREGWEAQ
jgi:phage gp16-like protein